MNARTAVSRYLQLSRKLDAPKSTAGRPGYIVDVSGSYIDANVAQRLVDHLVDATRLDLDRDQFRAMLASEYWRQCRFAEARTQFELIRDRGLSHQQVAKAMLIEIERATLGLAP